MPYRHVLIGLMWGCLIAMGGTAWAQQLSSHSTWWDQTSKQVFRDDCPKRMWVKLDLMPVVQRWHDQRIQGMVSLSLEHKVRTAWSAVVQVQRQYTLRLSPDASPGAPGWMGLDVGARYYYHLLEDMKAGRQANNLNGSYLGLTLGTRMEPPRYNARSEWHSDNLAVTLQYGLQRQVFRFGYSDIGFGVQVSYDDGRQAHFIYPIQVRRGWQVYPVAHLNLGLGW